MAGYWRKPVATAAVLSAGRLRTGDIGYLDEDGYLFIVDRIKDVIIAGGFKIYPRLVEEAIFQHPQVRECIVIGVPDRYRGQTVKAFVVLREGEHLTAKDLVAFLRDKLSPIEMPKLFEFRASLPKTLIGKPSKKALIEEEEARRKPAQAESARPTVTLRQHLAGAVARKRNPALIAAHGFARGARGANASTRQDCPFSCMAVPALAVEDTLPHTVARRSPNYRPRQFLLDIRPQLPYVNVKHIT